MLLFFHSVSAFWPVTFLQTFVLYTDGNRRFLTNKQLKLTMHWTGAATLDVQRAEADHKVVLYIWLKKLQHIFKENASFYFKNINSSCGFFASQLQESVQSYSGLFMYIWLVVGITSAAGPAQVKCWTDEIAEASEPRCWYSTCCVSTASWPGWSSGAEGDVWLWYSLHHRCTNCSMLWSLWLLELHGFTGPRKWTIFALCPNL